MAKQNNSKRYLFQADATGVAAQFASPYDDVIPIQSASTLPSIGGRGSSHHGGFQYKDILSFGSAYTEVVGIEAEDGVFETVALSVVENFNLLGIVKCDRIVAKLSGQASCRKQRSRRELHRAGRQRLRRASHTRCIFREETGCCAGFLLHTAALHLEWPAGCTRKRARTSATGASLAAGAEWRSSPVADIWTKKRFARLLYRLRRTHSRI